MKTSTYLSPPVPTARTSSLSLELPLEGSVLYDTQSLDLQQTMEIRRTSNADDISIASVSTTTTMHNASQQSLPLWEKSNNDVDRDLQDSNSTYKISPSFRSSSFRSLRSWWSESTGSLLLSPLSQQQQQHTPPDCANAEVTMSVDPVDLEAPSTFTFLEPAAKKGKAVFQGHFV